MSDPHVLGPDLAPTPFTANDIRAASPVGRTIRTLVERVGAEPYIRVHRYVSVDDEGAWLESARFTTDGAALDDPETGRSTWADLQAHAAFPVEETTIRPELIETPIGPLDCLRYTVTDGSTVQTFWFARAIPGMPIRYSTEEGGRTTMTVTVIANEVPEP